MPKTLHKKNPKTDQKLFSVVNFTPFLNFQIKRELTLSFSDISKIKENTLENRKSLNPGKLQNLIDYIENINVNLEEINETIDLMGLLRELEQNYPLQPQKIIPELHFAPIIEKYRKKAKIQGINLTSKLYFPSNPLLGGKVEFEHILELFLRTTLQNKSTESIKIFFEINDERLLFTIRGISFKTEKISKNEAYQHTPKGLHVIRIYLTNKLVKKLKGSIIFIEPDEVQVQIPVKPWKKN